MMEAISKIREATQIAIEAIDRLQAQLATQQVEIDRLKRQAARPRFDWVWPRRPQN